MRLALAVALLAAAPVSAVAQEAPPRVSHQWSEGRPFSGAVQVGDTYWFSGKIGASAETRAMTEGRTAAETRAILEQFRGLFEELGLGFEDVVQATVYLSDIGTFGEMNGVYVEYFPTEPPARETVAVAGLAGGATIEISFVAVKR